MFRIIFITFFLVFQYGLNVYGQKIDSIYLEKSYNFINSTIVNDSLKYNLSERTTFGLFRNDTTSLFEDTLFDSAQKMYFRNQFKMLGTINWPVGKITGSNVLTHEETSKVFKKKKGWSKFRKKFGDCLTSFSLPIFDINYNYCIFYNWTQCDYLAGSGSISLYKFENKKWVFVKTYIWGIS